MGFISGFIFCYYIFQFNIHMASKVVEDLLNDNLKLKKDNDKLTLDYHLMARDYPFLRNVHAFVFSDKTLVDEYRVWIKEQLDQIDYLEKFEKELDAIKKENNIS